MIAVSCTQKTAGFLAGIYGVVAIIGGTIGYINAGSVASIIAGGVSGVLLVLCAWATLYFKPLWGLLGAAVISIALLGRFMPGVVRYLSGAASEIHPVSIVMSVGGLIVLLASVIALTKKGSC